VDLLERAQTLAACPLFENLAPAVLVRLAARARADELERGERRTTDENVWVVAAGTLAVAVRSEAAGVATASLVRRTGAPAIAGNALGFVRVVRAATPVVVVVAVEPSVLVGLAVDDVRDVLEEDPRALASLVQRLAAVLVDATP
jgi:hypothetical protein